MRSDDIMTRINPNDTRYFDMHFKIEYVYDEDRNIKAYNVFEEGKSLEDLNCILTTASPYWAKKVCNRLNELYEENIEKSRKIIHLKNALNDNIKVI